jgi:cysteine desulfurase
VKKIYFDHAATTHLDSKVLEKMLPYLKTKYGNASSLHNYGQESKDAIEKARKELANILKCSSEEIIFTSCGSESDSLAIIGYALANKSKGNHIITSKFEHPAVLEACKFLETQGFEISYISITKQGLVDIEKLKKSITKKTILVSIMHANNEIGTIQPIEEIYKICKDKSNEYKTKIVFHTDAVQTFGKIEINSSMADMISISAHKFYGPKGIGLLYKKSGINIKPIIHGHQEKNLRGGTYNTASIVGMAEAAKIAQKEKDVINKKLKNLTEKLTNEVLKIENTWINGIGKGAGENKLPGLVNFGFLLIEGESILMHLDNKGIMCSTGSACSSDSLQASHVLLALGLKPEEAHGSLRISLGKENTEEDIDYFLSVLPEIVEKLRNMSPFKNKAQLKSFKGNSTCR